MISAGKLRERVTLQQRTTATNAANGEVTEVWAVVGARAAMKGALRLSELQRTGQTQGQAEAKLLMRLDTQTRQINATWRIGWRGVNYDIVGLDPDYTEGALTVLLRGAVA